jgi:filamentous hemagglutinin family protein
MLLHSVSVTALLASTGAAIPGKAHAGSFKSINQAVSSGAGATAMASANAAATQAAKQAGLGARNVAAAASRFISLSQALSGLSYSGPAIPNGVTAGGLQQAAGVAGSNGTTLWSGAASNLTQTLSNGVTDVTVTQTGSVASLAWQSFNIGAKTKLVFNQSAGGSQANSWVVINTISNPSESPTTILGEISAPGKVFILNPNGILFGAGSQLNVGSLIGSTANIAQAQLTAGANGLINGFSLYGTISNTTGAITSTFTGGSSTGSIVVQPGASIVTAAPSGTSAGGYVMLLADTVQNGGLIATPQGQTVLAAGTEFYIQPGYSTSNPTSTVIGSEVAVSNAASGTALGTLGTATNSGILLADQGDITMVGHNVVQAGVIEATTTVDLRGTVHLLTDTSDATASVTLAPGSVTEILPEDNGETALNSQRASNLANSITDNALRTTPAGATLNDYNTLADTLGESRIEISTGGSVTMQTGALALAQGGQVAVNAGLAITLQSGATVDVSGTNAVLPATANSLFIQGIVPFYLRDSAANRTGGLEFANVYVDEQNLVEIAGGAYAGNIYTAGGLLEVSGNLGLVPHGIAEWASIGGQVTLQSATIVAGTPVGGTVTVAAGATINLTGGTVTYDAGLVPQSYVQAADGQIYNINEAPGDMVYAGVYTGDVEAHPRWRISNTFNNPLLTPAQISKPEYTIGRDAGSLTIAAAAGTIDGTIDAGVTVGASQTGGRPTGITDPFLLAQAVVPLSGSLDSGIYEGGAQYGTLAGSLFNTNVLIAGSGSLPGTLVTGLPDSVTGTISVDGAQLTADGFANVTFYTSGGIGVAAPIAAANGGTVVLGGTVIVDDESITAHGGTIQLTNLLPQSGAAFQAIAATPGAIVVANGVTLDASGTWTNLDLDPANTSQEGYAAGGSVSILGTGPVDLAAGAVIDVSSGGVLSAAGKLAAEAGGSVTVSADIVPLQAATLDASGGVTYAAQFEGFATGAGGTLSLTAPVFELGTDAQPPANTVVLGSGFFSTGFGSYAVNGAAGLSVDASAQIAVVRPVAVFTDPLLPSFAPASEAFSIALPVLYAQAKGGDSLTQRTGASLSLESSINPAFENGGGGDVTIAAGAAITVDPKQSLTVAGYGQVTVYGTLTAHCGTITVAQTRYEVDTALGSGGATPTNYQDGLSVWIASGALLDASGQAVVMNDALGRRFGQAQAGGTIILGGLGGANAASQESSYAQVMLRQGATLDVAGASATVDVVPSTELPAGIAGAGPTTLAGAGGTIVARSYDGVALDGTMLAAGSGAGAAGGTLIMRLDPQDLTSLSGLPENYFVPSQIIVTQDAAPVQPISGIAPGDPATPDTLRLGAISQQQITAGGFDTLSLYAQDQIVFQGSVDLTLGRSLTLSTTTIGDAQNAGAVHIAAPYVSLAGYSPNANGGLDADGAGLTSELATTATFAITASLIDIVNQIDLGGTRAVGTPTASNGATLAAPVTASSYGFSTASFNSAGDIRFDQNPAQSDNDDTILASSGNIVFDARQLYPETGAIASVIAGQSLGVAAGSNQLAGGTLTVLAQNGPAAGAPASVGGTLSLIADTVVQDGVVRAPEGVIVLGQEAANSTTVQQFTDAVTLGAASVTSVSLYGQTVPYGGTVDGVNYLYDGAAPATFAPVVAIASATVDVETGATVDLRGGGTLAGAGFVAGRGGSANVNTTPLLNSSSGTVTANATDQVYAILPGAQPQYAPVAPGDAGYDVPAEGAQITIRAGEVAGLAAGTYTLLPAYYDLLPGGFRVELTGAAMPAGAASPFGNFTTEAAVTLGIANTAISAATPTAALITSGAGVRQLSQFDEESYNSFEVAQAATFDSPRPLLPEDAKTLLIELNTPGGAMPANDRPISIAASSLQESAPAGGYGATLEITAAQPIEILGAGEAVVPVTYMTSGNSGTTAIGGFGIDAAMLDALAVPRLVLGGTLVADPTYANQVDIQSLTPAIVVMPAASLAAGDIMLTAEPAGMVQVDGGATLSTLGEPSTAFGLAQGIYFNSDQPVGASPVLALSNSQIVFTPNALSSTGGITLQSGAVLRGAGSLDFTAPQGASVAIGDATLQAAQVNVQVANITIGSTPVLAEFAGILPAGLTLDAATLNTLVQTSSSLTLTAQDAVNILGSVALNSQSTSLVLNAPAIYGYGIASSAGGVTTPIDAGTASITAPSFTWSGVSTAFTLQTDAATTISAVPGGQLAGGVATSTGSLILTGAAGLTVAAKTIELGYGPDTQVDDQVVLDRLAVGFGAVTLQAAGEITANNQSSLSVFATQTMFGQPGIAGNLMLDAPLITAASGAVLELTAGGTLSATNPGTVAATGTVATLGATIDLTAGTIDIGAPAMPRTSSMAAVDAVPGTAFALPSGAMTITAAAGIYLGSQTMLDLSGRSVALFDQAASSTGGTLVMAAAGGTITEAAGAVINVASPGAAAGSVSATAADGMVTFDGSLLGSATAGHSGGSFSIYALALPNFDALNTTLDAGGFTAARNFEAATGPITVDGTVTAHTVTIAADAGDLDVTGLINASGATPGSIALSANGTLTLGATAVLDAHATTTQVDSYGEPIDAENQAHVTLTAGIDTAPGAASTGGVVLDAGATINVGYPGASADPLGEVVINAPRIDGNSVAVTASGSLNIVGAESIALYAFATYAPTDQNGTVVQDNGTGETLGSGYSPYATTGVLGIVQVGLDNETFMDSAGTNTTLLGSIAGLVAYGSGFHLRPGVLIESSEASGGNLTITGDIDLSGLRYSDPSGFGTVVTPGTAGSGEPGAIALRATNDLTVNGSVSDGFAAPPDETSGTPLNADSNGWKYLQQPYLGGEITNQDLLLPAGAVAKIRHATSTQIVLEGSTNPNAVPATTFDTTRPISLNYAIVINSATVNADVVIPFALTVGANQGGPQPSIPAGGWVATAPVIRNGVTLYSKGQLIPAGFTFEPGDILGSGTVLPVQVETGVDASGTGQTIPAGTPFAIFYDSTITLAQNTTVLPVNALIPSNTDAVFGAISPTSGATVGVNALELRATGSDPAAYGYGVQGYLYPLAQMLPAGSLSWSMDFVAGANQTAANPLSVQPATTLTGGVFAAPAGMTNQAAGSLLLDDLHYYQFTAGTYPSLAFSVIRTGTGDLSLVAGGDIDQSSLYGIYTAGTQTALSPAEMTLFNLARQNEGGTDLLDGRRNEAASALISATYQAYYPNGGGDLLFAAQGDVTGDIFTTTSSTFEYAGTPASDGVGNWLWRQGSTQLGQATAWWINFGTLADAPVNPAALPVQMVGFQGIGTLGGGNVTVTIGGDAGQMTDRDENAVGQYSAPNQSGEGLIIAAGSTGRLLPGATVPEETGGGDISVTIGGTLNPIDAVAYKIGASQTTPSQESPAVDGDIIDTRGNITVTAGAIGRIDPIYQVSAIAVADPRALDPFVSEDGIPNGGIEVVPGDGSVDIATLRDLVLAGAADPGRVPLQSYTSFAAYSSDTYDGGDSGFTLWTAGTSISLFSAGGNVTPTTIPNTTLSALTYANDDPTDYRSIYPPTLLVTAATGNVIYGQYNASPAFDQNSDNAPDPSAFSLELMPATDGELSFLAGGSISANFYAVDISGANPAGLSLPTDPAFQAEPGRRTPAAITNIIADPGTNQSPLALFALEADTPTTDLHAADTTPTRFYAAGGDVLDLVTGETLSFTTNNNADIQATWYIAAKPVWILASQDIVSAGTRPASDPNGTIFATQENQVQVQGLGNVEEYSSGNLFLNTSAQSVSVISAGRDILSTYAYGGGPGLLEVQAGRNLYQASSLDVSGGAQILDFGAIKSLGDDVIAGTSINLSGGAGISVLAGVGPAGPDYAAFAALYFNPDNQADLSIPLADPANTGKVQQVYTAQLVTWLAANYGYAGDETGALTAFQALPAIDQDVFVRQVFFAELAASGAQESNPNSPFYKSYLRGQTAIDKLLPSTGKETTIGDPVGYNGGITMYSGTVFTPGGHAPITTSSGANATFDGGIATLFGGTVQVIDPGGQAIFGVPGGPAPGNNSGIVTYGSGDIDIYALGNVLLGQSRIFTTAGGNILIWSSAGDINAGIGAKTTQVYDPPVLVYDDVGDITDTPPAITTGAGIATLQPLPEVPAGDVSLIAPEGTIDAGEAGIRVSGNLVLAAQRIVGTANIQTKGSTQGEPTISIASLGAAEAAGAAAGASTSAAQSQAGQTGEARTAASVLDIEVLSIGGSYDEEEKKRRRGL